MNLKHLKIAGISLLALAAVGSAIAQIPQNYTPGPNDTVKIATGAGSYVDAPFQRAVQAAGPCANLAPVVASGFGTNAAIVKSASNCAFSLTSGTTAASNGTITMPAATDGWTCDAQDITTSSNAIFITKMTNATTNVVTLDGFQSNGAVGNWVANDTVVVSCQPF